ncbi:hypothethical protein (plasmid) [Ralstonia solanacearum CMR15]|nr:hypothethical protein [Ralstonia solanacearum CMR15]
MASLPPLQQQGEHWAHVVVRKEKDPLVDLDQTNDVERFWSCSRSVLSFRSALRERFHLYLAEGLSATAIATWPRNLAA